MSNAGIGEGVIGTLDLEKQADIIFLSCHPPPKYERVICPKYKYEHGTCPKYKYKRVTCPKYEHVTCPKYKYEHVTCPKYKYEHVTCPKYKYKRVTCPKYKYEHVTCPKYKYEQVTCSKYNMDRSHILKNRYEQVTWFEYLNMDRSLDINIRSLFLNRNMIMLLCNVQILYMVSFRKLSKGKDVTNFHKRHLGGLGYA